MNPFLLSIVVGARPNFMKVAPLIRAIEARPDEVAFRLIHTGQHSDAGMSRIFFDELGIPAPDVHLNCGGGTQAEQTGRMLVALDAEFSANRPNAVVVVGDVTSTLAGAIAAKRLDICLAHVEAGLRSGDMRMPEEVNRVLVDAITDMYFVTEPAGCEALRREGRPADRIHYVGNVMVDNLFQQAEILRKRPVAHPTSELKRSLAASGYGVVTLHRPSNVDDPATAEGIVRALATVSEDLPLVFPMHPRTKSNFERFGLRLGPNVHVVGPLPYQPFLDLWSDARIVLTDSGGLQEETTALGIRCVTVRENTERPVTIAEGTNVLAGTDPDGIVAAVRASLAAPVADRRPRYWDGRSAQRIVDAIVRHLASIHGVREAVVGAA
jgi:UDP-N-acetylglucosamine 2-epimerase (non-hydrolysing)